MMRKIVVMLFVIVPVPGFSQCMSAYQDFRQFLYIHDNGRISQQEFQPIQSYQMGARYLAYVDNNADFKIYGNGITTVIQSIAPNDYHVTDEMVVYLNPGNFLYAIYNDKQYELGQVVSYTYGDSIIAFTDIFGWDKIFFRGEISQLENRNIEEMKAGDNLLAYFDESEQFKVWDHGVTTILEPGSRPSAWEVNRNIIAYVDYLGAFKVYWNGNTYKLENFAPYKFSTGEDFVAYTTQNNEFKVFYQGNEIDLLTIAPGFIDIQEDVMVFTDNNRYFYAYWKGQVKRLENYTPATYQIDDGIVVYQDLDNRLNGFVQGQFKQMSGGEVATTYRVINQSVTFYKVQSHTRIYCNGKVINAL